ncbi:hypothetical protein ACN3XK_74915 [Actinomadura welshii]
MDLKALEFNGTESSPTMLASSSTARIRASRVVSLTIGSGEGARTVNKAVFPCSLVNGHNMKIEYRKDAIVVSLLDVHIPQLVTSESAFGAKAALMRSKIHEAECEAIGQTDR